MSRRKASSPSWAKRCCKNKSCVQDSDISGIILIRMSIKVFHTASLVIVAFLAVSCVEPITLDPMQEMPVVVVLFVLKAFLSSSNNDGHPCARGRPRPFSLGSLLTCTRRLLHQETLLWNQTGSSCIAVC